MLGKNATELKLAQRVVVSPIGIALGLVDSDKPCIYGRKIKIKLRERAESTLCLVDCGIARLAIRTVGYSRVYKIDPAVLGVWRKILAQIGNEGSLIVKISVRLGLRVSDSPCIQQIAPMRASYPRDARCSIFSLAKIIKAS